MNCWIFGLAIIAAILISGCVQQEKTKITEDGGSVSEAAVGIQELLPSSADKGLGTFCFGEKECVNFCLNNRGQCEVYCKGKENELCKIIFPSEEKESKTTSVEDQKGDQKPVLKNLGVNIESWNKQTNLAGDLIFDRRVIYDDGRVANDKVFLDFGHVDKYRTGIPTIEYWFFVPLGTNVYAPIDGTVQIGFFEHTQDWGISFYPEEGSNWIVSFEHVVNLAVKDGDRVNAGDIVAEAAPRINKEIAMVELAVWIGGVGIYKYCPFEFLDESLKPIYKEKINQLAKDWEEFIGKDVYKQEDWVAPGCLLHNITER